MNELNINTSWTFKELVENIEVIKSQIWDIITSFSCFDIKKEFDFKRRLRKTIYSFKFEEWRRDRILEYIYNDVEFDVLKKLI